MTEIMPAQAIEVSERPDFLSIWKLFQIRAELNHFLTFWL